MSLQQATFKKLKARPNTIAAEQYVIMIIRSIYYTEYSLQLFERDPVRTVQLSQYVAARLQEAEAACGGAQPFQAMYLEQVDPTVMQQIQAYLA